MHVATWLMTHRTFPDTVYRTPNISGTSSIIGFNSVLNVSNVFPFLKYLPVNVDSKDSGPILFSKWIPRAHQQQVSSFTHKAVVNPQNEPLWIGHFADVQVFLCSSTPLRRVVGEYWRSCSLTRTEWFKLYFTKSHCFWQASDYLLDCPDQSGVSGSIPQLQSL